MERRASDLGKGQPAGQPYKPKSLNSLLRLPPWASPTLLESPVSPLPVKKVVGFHVEGMAESPAPKKTLEAEMHHVGSGPLPVIIPLTTGRPQPSKGPSHTAMETVVETSKHSGTEETSPARTTSAPPPQPTSRTPTPTAAQAQAARGDAAPTPTTTTTTTPDAARAARTPTARAAETPEGGPGTPGSARSEGREGEERRSAKPSMSSMTRAERRAYQDAQRAAKAAAKEGAPGPSPSPAPAASPAPSAQGTGGKKPPTPRDASAPARTPDNAAAKRPAHDHEGSNHGSTVFLRQGSTGGAGAGEKSSSAPRPTTRKAAKSDEPREVKRPALFSHLPVVSRSRVAELVEREAPAEVHPAVVQLARAYGERTVSGSNARVVALLYAIKTVAEDHLTAPGTFGKGLLTRINDNIKYLIQFRPLSLAMGNALKYVKAVIAAARERSEEDAGRELMDAIDVYVRERIIYADEKCIFIYAMSKIRQEGDVILTYAYSHAVFGTLQAAHRAGKSFRVVVVDSRPGNEGRRMVQKLLQLGVSCSYTHVGALSYIMKEASLVLLGAAAVLSNGSIISRAGTALVAMMANMVESRQVPVLVCCETHKFHERVQNDSITYNELGDPELLARVPGRPDTVALDQWETNEHLHLLNLTYDLTPPHLVSVIVTELGLLPPSSVPVVIRETRKESYLL